MNTKICSCFLLFQFFCLERIFTRQASFKILSCRKWIHKRFFRTSDRSWSSNCFDWLLRLSFGCSYDSRPLAYCLWSWIWNEGIKSWMILGKSWKEPGDNESHLWGILPTSLLRSRLFFQRRGCWPFATMRKGPDVFDLFYLIELRSWTTEYYKQRNSFFSRARRRVRERKNTNLT